MNYQQQSTVVVGDAGTRTYSALRLCGLTCEHRIVNFVSTFDRVRSVLSFTRQLNSPLFMSLHSHFYAKNCDLRPPSLSLQCETINAKRQILRTDRPRVKLPSAVDAAFGQEPRTVHFTFFLCDRSIAFGLVVEADF